MHGSSIFSLKRAEKTGTVLSSLSTRVHFAPLVSISTPATRGTEVERPNMCSRFSLRTCCLKDLNAVCASMIFNAFLIHFKTFEIDHRVVYFTRNIFHTGSSEKKVKQFRVTLLGKLSVKCSIDRGLLSNLIGRGNRSR